MTGYRPRRLRPERAPRWVLRYEGRLTAEIASAVVDAWRAAGRVGVLLIDDTIRIERLDDHR
jgi:hypothetical protein